MKNLTRPHTGDADKPKNKERKYKKKNQTRNQEAEHLQTPS
jgi:hypothetical protein